MLAAARRAVDAVRAADWWAYKIPPLLLTLYAGVLRFDEHHSVWGAAALALAAIVSVAVYGYVQNDLCDIDADRASGRPNRMAHLDAGVRLWVMVTPAVLALALAWSTRDPVVLGLIGMNLIVPALYSVPPIRLKGRGVLGALADAVGVHALPMATIAWVVVAEEPVTISTRGFFWSAVGWASLAGFRGIVAHQVADRESDAAAGVHTFGGALGEQAGRWMITRVLLPVEVVSLSVFLTVAAVSAPVVWSALGVWAIGEALKMFRGWTMPLLNPARTSPERYVPVANNEIYEMWLPLAFAVELALRTPALWWLVAIHVYAFYPNLRTRARVAARVLRRS